MKNLILAMEEEQRYVADRLKGIDTSLPDRLSVYGYNNLNEYFKEKQEYFREKWYPEVYYVDVCTLTTELENAVQNNKYGIYISVADGLYAFHGSDEINYDLCEKLNVCVAELYYNGGTIIGGSADLGIEIVAPKNAGLNASCIMKKFYEIISRYVENVEISGNDILVNGEKVMGSMRRNVGNTFIWAAQVSFGDYSKIIKQVCNKKSSKKPSYIDSTLLTRDYLEKEVVTWLQKQQY